MIHRSVTVLLVAALVLLALPGTAAADCADGAATLTDQDVQALADVYNQNTGELPDFLANQFAGERVELRMTGDTIVVYTVTFDDAARATSITEGSEDPTLRVTVASATLCQTLQSDNPAAEFASAYQNGDVDIDGIGPANALKVTVLKTAISIARVFGFF